MFPAPIDAQTRRKPRQKRTARTPYALMLRRTRLALAYTIDDWRKLLHVGWRTVEGWELDGCVPHASALIRLKEILAWPQHRARLTTAEHHALRTELQEAGLWG